MGKKEGTGIDCEVVLLRAHEGDLWQADHGRDGEREQTRSNKNYKNYKNDKEYNMADEMADILWVLVCLANQTGVDLTEAFKKNLEKKTNRDKDRHINNGKLKIENWKLKICRDVIYRVLILNL